MTKQQQKQYESAAIATEVEQVLLGTVLVYPNAIQKCMEMDLRPEAFYHASHQSIYREMLKLAGEGTPVDIPLMVERCSEFKVQGPGSGSITDYLSKLMDSAVSAEKMDSYIDTVLDRFQRRSLIAACQDIMDSAGSDTPLENLLDESEKKLTDVTRARRSAEFQHASSVISNVNDRLRALERGDILPGIMTGFSDLNRLTGGLHPGELIILAARPSMGKSAFALNIAGQVASRNSGAVVLFSLEMAAASLMNRMLAAESSIPLDRFKDGKLVQDEWNRLYRAENIISERAIYLDDTSMITMGEIYSRCRKLRTDTGKLSLIVVDYLQLIQGNGRKTDSRQQEITEISRGLKLLAMEMECPVLALSQLSRKVEDRTSHEPQLADLRDSGAIEQDADMVMFLYRDSYYSGEDQPVDTVDLSLKKNRNGAIGKIQLCFRKECSQFTGLSYMQP